MIDIKNIPILNDAACSLKETSFNKINKYYMTDSIISVINFDSVKDKYIKNLSLSETPKSNDALYILNNNEMYFIEFKSGEMSPKEIFDVRLKIFDSLLILTDIIDKNISFTRQHLNYILVYNEEKNPLTEKDKDEKDKLQNMQSKTFIKKHYLEKKGKENYIRFALRRFEKLYFKNVFTVNQNEFENDFIKIWIN